MAQNKWYVYTKRADFEAVARKFGISQIIARILRNRDIVTDDEIELALHGTLDDLYDEGLMPDMQQAATAIITAIEHHEHIRIVGDYDIDGVCAVYILEDALTRMGAHVDHCIPDRINDGYGINVNIVRKAAANGVDLILTCDNGIAAIEEMEEASRLGLKVVITDHHAVRKDEHGEDIIPRALAVVDVKRSDSLYPSEECCGAVTSWKLIRYISRSKGLDDISWLRYLDVAAVATVGDIMKLTGENRIIVREGLKYINYNCNKKSSHSSASNELSLPSELLQQPMNPGLETLIFELGLGEKKIDTYHIGFVIGPSINASGRLETADTAEKLLLSKDPKEEALLAGHLRYLNQSRKDMTQKGVEEGIRQAENKYADSKVLVIYLEDLHESLAGIVAGKIKDHTGKPCILVTPAKQGLKGSGRSIENYDMFKKICEADKYLTRYGGHKMAAGMSLDKENLEPFRDFLNKHCDLQDEDLIKKIWIDVPAPLKVIDFGLINQIEALAPFGNGFESPLFADKNLLVRSARVVGKNGNALKVVLSDASGRVYDAIMFGEGSRYAQEIGGHTINILYVPTINNFMGRSSIQFEIKDYVVVDDVSP